jgi:hypothetical protein
MTRKIIAVILFLLFISACSASWQDKLGIIWPRPTCSNAVRYCQTHWLLCAGSCDMVRDKWGKKIKLDRNHPQGLDQVCTKQLRGARAMCQDVIGVSFETAICMDYEEGWCPSEFETCMPKPEKCQ